MSAALDPAPQTPPPVPSLAAGAARPTQLARLARRHTQGALLSILTHELSQPLMALGMYSNAAAQLARTGAVAADELADVLCRIESQVKRATELLTRVRAFTREAGSGVTVIDLCRTVADVLTLVRPLAADKQVTLQLECPAEPVPITADGVHIGQVIVNLLFNSIEAIDQAGSSERRVWVDIVPEPAAVRVTVYDTGPGIGPDEALRLFAGETTDKPAGCGFGLAISRALIEAQGGQLWADPHVSSGAALHFRLPVARRAPAAD